MQWKRTRHSSSYPLEKQTENRNKPQNVPSYIIARHTKLLVELECTSNMNSQHFFWHSILNSVCTLFVWSGEPLLKKLLMSSSWKRLTHPCSQRPVHFNVLPRFYLYGVFFLHFSRPFFSERWLSRRRQ